MNINGYIHMYLFKSTNNFDNIFKELNDRSLTISDFRWHQECLKFEEDQEKLLKKIDEYETKTQKLFIVPALQKMSTHMREYVKVQYDGPNDDEPNFSNDFLRFIKNNKLDLVIHIVLLNKFEEFFIYKHGKLICEDKFANNEIQKRNIDKKYVKYAKYIKLNDIDRLDPIQLINFVFNTEFRW